MSNYTSFDDWKAWMQTVITENGVGAITGPLLQTVLGELSDTAEWLVSVSGSSADARALAAEGWAVGTQRGVPVTEGSPYYQNNSLYWSQQVMATAGDLATLVQQAQTAIRGADDAAADATRAAGSANDAAGLATEKAGLANDAAELATQKAGLADDAATLANTKAGYAEEQGNYARDQINGAKGDYESLDARFDHVDEISMYFEETGLSADPELIDEYDRVLAQAYQCITDMLTATRMANNGATRAEGAANYAEAKASEADQASRNATEQSQRAASAADEAEQVAEDARAAAADAVAKTRLCETATDGANTAAGLATEKSQLAADAATLANQKAAYAQDQGDYSKAQGDYAKSEIDGAKGNFESLDARFDHVDEISMYFEETGLSADPALVDEYRRVLAVAYQAIDDLKAMMVRGAEVIASVSSVIADAQAAIINAEEKTVLAGQAAAYATAQGNYAKTKADEIEDAKGVYRTLGDRLDAMQRTLEQAVYFQTENH